MTGAKLLQELFRDEASGGEDSVVGVVEWFATNVWCDWRGGTVVWKSRWVTYVMSYSAISWFSGERL